MERYRRTLRRTRGELVQAHVGRAGGRLFTRVLLRQRARAEAALRTHANELDTAAQRTQTLEEHVAVHGAGLLEQQRFYQARVDHIAAQLTAEQARTTQLQADLDHAERDVGY